ncbi:MAG: DnaJ domain-containing protein [Candidatus Poribacteria bacterium]
MDPGKDYYLLLEVHPKASGEIIDRAKRVLLLRYHPDHNVDKEDAAAAQTRLVIEAHSVLSDPAKRAAYDAAISGGVRQGVGKSSGKAAQRGQSDAPRREAAESSRPRGPRAQPKQSRSGRPGAAKASAQAGVRVLTCQSCGASSPIRADRAPRDVTCGACGNPLRPGLGPRTRDVLGRVDDRLEQARAWVLGLLRGRDASIRPRRREKSS